jgi:hypothetical protein
MNRRAEPRKGPVDAAKINGNRLLTELGSPKNKY